jgi:hypothetical protein
MKTPRMTAWILGILAAGLCLAPTSAQAQSRAARSGQRPAPELSATYGSMWGGNVESSMGTFRLGTGGSMGFALDVPVRSGTTVELSYTRQDGTLDLDSYGVTTLADMSVNYFQIGTLQSLRPGRVIPFILGTLGATYYSPDVKSFTIGEETFSLESTTKFSLNLGLGLKAYFGEAQRVGLRASFKVLPTFYNTSGGMWVGTGGGGVSFSGSSIWQYEAAAGLTVRLGG